MVVVGASVVVVVVVVVVVCSFGFTIVLVTERFVPLKSSAFTTVSAAVITYPAGASDSVKIYLSFNRALTVILPLASVTYSPITWLFA